MGGELDQQTERCDVYGFSPGTAAAWTRLSDFIKGDGKLSVSERDLFSPLSFSLSLYSLPDVNNLESLAESKQKAGGMRATLQEVSFRLDVVY